MDESAHLTLDLTVPHRIHVVGAGGSGMSAIATVLVAMGHRLSGSDLRPSAALEHLGGIGVEVTIGHHPDQVAAADVLTRSTAVPDDDPEVVAARKAGVRVVSRAEMLAAITRLRRTVSVTGTHGKTTTSSMLALILDEAGLQPSFIVGGDIRQLGTGARWSGGEWLVVEADESDGTFLRLDTEIGIVTSVEPDHLEHYGGWPQLRDAFARFTAAIPGVRVVSADDPTVAELARSYPAVTFGTAEGSTYRMIDVVLEAGSVGFAIERDGRAIGRVEVPMAGLHNARNACAAAVAALEMGVPFAAVADALGRFGGVARRFELRGELDGVTYIDDYAHLPREVASAVAAARNGRWHRVVVAFQPHRYSRTEGLWADFADAFCGADALVVTDIYPAGEAPRKGVSGKLIVEAVLDAHPGQRVAYLPQRPDVVRYLRQVLRPGDLCLTLGAGDLTTVADELLAREPA